MILRGKELHGQRKSSTAKDTKLHEGEWDFPSCAFVSFVVNAFLG